MDDLINRADAVRWVKTECNPYGKPTLDFESGKKVIEHLEQMPSAQQERTCEYWDNESKFCALCRPSAEPQRKKGRWIRITQGAMPEQYICPFCHRTVESYGVEELLSIRYPYCHCGADMRGDEDEKRMDV